MQLSERVRRLAPSPTFAITNRVRQLRAEGRDVIGFGAGEPDFDTPANVVDAAVGALRAGLTHYAPVAGDAASLEAIAAKLRSENGIACTAEDVVISCGAKQSIYLTLQALVDPGARNRVVLLTPAWVSYRAMAELAGGDVVEVAAAVEDDFKVRPEALDAALDDRTAVVILNSPSNPCGTMYTPDELRALAEVVAAHPGVVVVSDEIYEKIIFGGVAHFSIGSVPSIADRVVTINGLSKAYAMTGWRLGYLAAPGDGGAVARAAARLQGQMTSHATTFLFPAVVEALERTAEAVEWMRQRFAARAELMSGRIERWPDVACARPTGAFYVFPDMRAYLGRRSPAGTAMRTIGDFAAAMLEEAGVAVVPGDEFGACAETHVRLGFACDEAQISEGCDRIERWLAGSRP